MAGEQSGDERRGASANDMTQPHEHNVGAAGAPGASSPGEPGYDGRVTVGDEGAAGDFEQEEPNPKI